MKFKKLDDNKIRIILTLNDMEINNISAETFLTNNDDAQNVLQRLISEAEKRIGFKTNNCSLMVEVISSPNGGCVFTITKFISDDELDDVLTYYYKFSDFDDFIDFCTYLKNMNTLNFKAFSKDISLIYYNSNYYLEIFSLYPESIYDILSEFSEKVSITSRI